jgi:catechol 2,3-dioxygenase-like lactoylglutathione lyase family enzyme
MTIQEPVRGTEGSLSDVDTKLEVVVIPVSDVDRAKSFYTRLGWRLDADVAGQDGFRVVQVTPPGSHCSVIFGSKVTTAKPGSAQGLHLIVSDIDLAHSALGTRGAEVSAIFHDAGGVFHRGGMGWKGGRAPSVPRQLWVVRFVQRSGWKRLAPSRSNVQTARTNRSERSVIRFCARPRERTPTCGSSSWRA